MLPKTLTALVALLSLPVWAQAPAPLERQSSPPDRPWSLGVGWAFPTSEFGVTAPVQGGRRWNVSFRPDATSVVSARVAYRDLRLAYSTEVDRDNDYDALRIEIPIYEEFSLAFAGARFRGASAQLHELAGTSGGRVAYNSSVPAVQRPDTRDRSAQLELKVQTSALHLLKESMSEPKDWPSWLDIAWIGTLGLYHDSISTESAFVPSEARADFGEAASLRLTQASGPGARGGLRVDSSIAARQRFTMTLLAGLHLLYAVNAYEGGRSEWKLPLGKSVLFEAEWAWTPGAHELGTRFWFDARLRSVAGIDFSAHNLGVGASYAYHF